MTGPATAAPFPRLFEPLRIGSVTLRNRIVSSGHDTVMAVDGFVTEQLIAYQAARAAGGVGLIVVQVAGVHESARYTSHVLMATEDDCIPGYRRLAEAVHGHGTAIVGQIFHDGRELMESMDGTLPVALAPSAVPNERFHVMPRAMPIPLIEEIRAGYASAARRLCDAGLDGVEVVASHGYLPAQFLNPRVNLRTDRYGGSPENRLRFLRETIDAIRAAIGRDPVVGLRISIDEITPEGLTPDDVLPALAVIDADGLIDYVSRRRGDVGDARRLRPHRPADDGAQRLHRAARGPGEGRRVGAGHRRGPHQPAAGGGARPRARAGRRLRDDPGAHLRPAAADEGRRRPDRRDPRLHRLQPGVHRALPRRLPDLLHPVPGERPRTGVRAAHAGDPPPRRHRGRRRARRAQGRHRRGVARPPRDALRGRPPGRRPGAARGAPPRSRRVRWRRDEPRRRGRASRRPHRHRHDRRPRPGPIASGRTS